MQHQETGFPLGNKTTFAKLNLKNGAIAKSTFRSSNLRRKIGFGYALAVGVAIFGTISGLNVGDYYQTQAQKKLSDAVEQEQLLNELQRNLLHMRLHQHEVINLLTVPNLFKEKHHHFLTHIDKVRKVLPQLKLISEIKNVEYLKGFLSTSSVTTEVYNQQMESLLNQVDPSNVLNMQPGEVKSRQNLLVRFTTSDNTLKFDGLLNDLIELITKAREIQSDSEKAVNHAQIIRTQIIVVSMFLSVMMAVALALYTSQEIAKPLEAATNIAQQVTKEANFNLQVPVTTQDEVGVLAMSLNQLIQWVAEYTQELEQARQTLENRVEERTKELLKNNQELQFEREKSERLLLNILPEPIAELLKKDQSNIAESFTDVTVLFGDIVDFTKMSAEISPQALINLLNKIFSIFDRLAHKHGLEKIKTIGDCYMVAGGLPMRRSDHAQAIAEIALDMQEEIAKFNADHNLSLTMRIGINSGPVIAGVIGTKKFIYDLWGDTVNIASRMETHGIAGSIQVTPATYDRLRQQYLFEERGPIYVKGKGEMTTYLLKGRKVCELNTW